MTLVAQQTDVLLVLQAKQEPLYRTPLKARHQGETGNLLEGIKMNLNMSDLSCAEDLVFHMAAAKLFLHCGTSGSVQHLLFHLQTSEEEIYVLCSCVSDRCN